VPPIVLSMTLGSSCQVNAYAIVRWSRTFPFSRSLLVRDLKAGN
jgi:hypothetical protein